MLATLGGDNAASLDTGMRVLQGAWDSAPDLPDIAAGILIERLRDEEHRPLSERARLLHALGLVPCRRAAEYLVDLAQRESGELQKLPVHRWLLLRAGNTGAEGQAVLMERLPLESDPVRRLDYLEALSARGGDAVRELLFALLEDPGTQPYEAVYAADRLARVGPTREVLPALKRAALRMQDYSARTALNCILWNWYPAP